MASSNQIADQYHAEIPVRLAPAVLKKLSQVSALRSVYYIGIQWLGIVAAIWLCSRHFNIATYLITVAWIGGRQHALGILVHDGSHYRLFKNKLTNDWVTDFFCSWPLIVTLDGFRKTHWPHHRNPNSQEDPTWMGRLTDIWVFPTSKLALAKLLLSDVSGLQSLTMIARLKTMSNQEGQATQPRKGFRLARIAYYLTLAVALTYFGVWKLYFLFWIIPIFTWLQMILRIRVIGEHYALEYDHALTLSRTTVPNLFDSLFIGPYNVGYHTDHHLFPSVPFYRLPELHAELMKDPTFRSRAHVTYGYINVLREAVNCKNVTATHLIPLIPQRSQV